MSSRLDIVPIKDSGTKEYIVRDDAGLSIKKIPEKVWEYLLNSYSTEKDLVGSLTNIPRPLLDPVNPIYGNGKEMLPTSTLHYKRTLSTDGEVIDSSIYSESGIIYSGPDAPLVAEGMRILTKILGLPLQLSFREEIAEPLKSEIFEKDNVSFLKVTINNKVLFYEEGFLLFSGENAEESFKNYVSSLFARGRRYSMKEFVYTEATAPAKYLRDL